MLAYGMAAPPAAMFYNALIAALKSPTQHRMSRVSPPPTRHIVLLQALRAAPARAAGLAQRLSPAGQGWQAAAGRWSCQELVAHLAAAEPLFTQRLRQILAADNPWLPRFGPETARPDSPLLLPELLAQFQAGRGQTLQLLSELKPEDWDRPAVHETLGPTTLLGQVQNLITHDTEHLSQLETLCQTWASQPFPPKEDRA